MGTAEHLIMPLHGKAARLTSRGSCPSYNLLFAADFIASYRTGIYFKQEIF
jgi:hypothetical protein